MAGLFTETWSPVETCPVCVDLDGTLIVADLFWEGLVRLIRRWPHLLFMLPLWALRGRAFLKHQVAQRVPIDPPSLQYRREVLDALEAVRMSGISIVLATGSNSIYATQVARHLGLFSDVIASDDSVNVSGRMKARILSERFGPKGFHYFGNSRRDLPVWLAARSATVVGASDRLARAARRRVRTEAVLAPKSGNVAAVVRAIRPYQWVKNLLVFVPVLTSHNLLNIGMLRPTVFAFIAFSLCASSIYVLNDILDLEADRLHPRKKCRPFAAGVLSIPAGLLAAAMLIVAGIAAATIGASPATALTLTAYIGITTAYSLWLKRQPVIDVFVLAGLYVLRVWAGGIASGIELSSWLLGFALFLFLSLAFSKRYAEIRGNGQMPGRGYIAADASWMHGIGISSGYMAALVLALYVSAPDVTALYRQPKVLWLLCPVMLFWITRMWFRAGRGVMHDDPVVEALKDPVTYGCAIISAIVLTIAV
jgi:4-hydroxybenzoate polyprenyltransferase